MAQLQSDKNGQQLDQDYEAQIKERWNNISITTVIAFYNAAVESEYTCLWNEAASYYKEALSLANRSMKPGNPMTSRIEKALVKV